jgi:hypothetical protein
VALIRIASRDHGIAEPATNSISADKAAKKLGWIAPFTAIGVPTSSQWTQEELNWKPLGPTLFKDMRSCYFQFRSQ